MIRNSPWRKCCTTNRRWISKDNYHLSWYWWEGFDDFDIQDIEEILEDRALNEEELVEMLDDPTTQKAAAAYFKLKTTNDSLGMADKSENVSIKIIL